MAMRRYRRTVDVITVPHELGGSWLVSDDQKREKGPLVPRDMQAQHRGDGDADDHNVRDDAEGGGSPVRGRPVDA